MILQSSINLKNQGVMVPNSTTQGNSYPFQVSKLILHTSLRCSKLGFKYLNWTFLRLMERCQQQLPHVWLTCPKLRCFPRVVIIWNIRNKLSKIVLTTQLFKTQFEGINHIQSKPWQNIGQFLTKVIKKPTHMFIFIILPRAYEATKIVGHQNVPNLKVWLQEFQKLLIWMNNLHGDLNNKSYFLSHLSLGFALACWIIWIKDQRSKLNMNFFVPNTQTFEQWKLNIKTQNFKVGRMHIFSRLQIKCYTMHTNHLHIATQSLHTQISENITRY
jgi:hypothetical protein